MEQRDGVGVGNDHFIYRDQHSLDRVDTLQFAEEIDIKASILLALRSEHGRALSRWLRVSSYLIVS